MQNLFMKATMIVFGLSTWAATAHAYRPCVVPTRTAPALFLSCSPRLDVPDAAYAKTLVSFVLSNRACDNRTGVADHMALSVSGLTGLGLKEREALSEHDTSRLPVAVGGNEKLRLIETAAYTEDAAHDVIEFTAGPRADGSETSSLALTIEVDKSVSYSNTRASGDDVSHPAQVRFTRILNDGRTVNAVEKNYGCSYVNEGVIETSFTRANGWKIQL